MNYTAIYHQLMQKRIDTPLSKDLYGEKHHIRPKSLGGCNSKSNIVRLTAREHFIAHLLLVKMFAIGTPERRKMLYAVYRFQKGNSEQQKITSRLYDCLRSEYSSVLSEQMKITMTGRKQTDEHRKNNAAARLGSTHSTETKEKMSIKQKNRERSVESGEKIAASKRGKPRSPETVEKMREGLKRRWADPEYQAKQAAARLKNAQLFG